MSSGGKLGAFLMRHRLPIAAVLVAITAFMAYEASRITIATRFVDLFPTAHPNTELYEKYRNYGGADRLVFMIKVKHGDIFNYATLKKIQQMQFAANALRLVNHNEVFSLASYQTVYVQAVPGGINYRCYMYPHVPKTPAQLNFLREKVYTHRGELSRLVGPHFKTAAIVASFNETGPAQNYSELFDDIEAIVHKYQDANHTIYVAGEPVERGYGYYYLPVIVGILVISIAMMVLALYLSLGSYSSWWVPLLTGSCSALWGLGFVGLRGYDFDPLMLVVPLILTARDMSHGVQWQRRYYYLLGQLGDQVEACIATTDYMFGAGLLAIAADVSGIIFISFSGIAGLDHVARAGTVWLLASLLMVFVFQPIVMSYLPAPSYEVGPRRMAWKERLAGLRDLAERVARFGVEPGVGRGALILGAAAFLVWGIVSGLRAQVGYQLPGTPLYRQGAKVNRDIRAIVKNFPIDEGWVIVHPTKMSLTENPFSYDVLRMENALRSALLQSPHVSQVITFANQGVMPFTKVTHDGYPKYLAIPYTPKQVAASVLFFMFNKAPGDMERYNWKGTSCIRILLKDHTSQTLTDVQRRLDEFDRTYLKHDKNLAHTRILYLGGIAGLYAAADDVLFRLDFHNIAFVLAAIFVFCALTFQSLTAGALFVLVCMLANFGAFIYMHLRHIGLTIDTVPVISLGIGLGVDYGIYTVSRIRDEVRGGMPLGDAIVLARTSTGGAVAMVLAIMIGALVPWVFSPALFHVNMSVLLMLLMMLNAVAGVMVLPAFLAWSRARFITRYLAGPSSQEQSRAIGGGS